MKLTVLTTRSEQQSIDVSGFAIFAHASDPSCFGLYYSFISVAGSILCAFCLFSSPSFSSLPPSTFHSLSD